MKGEAERVSLGWVTFRTAVEGVVDRVLSGARLLDTRRDQEWATQP